MKKWILQIACFGAILLCVAVVEYSILRKKDKENALVLFGNVDVRLVDISFRVTGRVDKVFFEEGDLVKQGQLLALLDRSPYDSQLDQAVASAEVVAANLKNAAILLERRKELIDIGGVSQEDLDNAQANYDQLYAAWVQAKAAQKVQEDNVSYTEVFAPSDGVVLTRVREPGSIVNPQDPVLTLSLASPVWIRAFAEEPQLGNIYYGQPAEIITDTKGAPTFRGQVGFISPVAEFTPKTVQTQKLRTDLVYRLRIYAENPDWRLKQGMPVTVKLKLPND